VIFIKSDKPVNRRKTQRATRNTWIAFA